MIDWIKQNTIGEEEETAVLNVLRSGLLSGFIAGPPGERDIPNGGPCVRELETKWALAHGVAHAITFNSATTALLAANKAVGVEQGDHVITTPWTMSATVSSALYCGAIVDFADIEPDYYCIDPDQVVRVMESLGHFNRLKAVIAVNLFGHPAQLEYLKEICIHRDIALIEDSAQMPWATENGAALVGDIGVHSLNRHKHIHCGEGGVAITDDDGLAKRLRSVRNHGIDPVGLNLRMTEIEAAIALCQLNKAHGPIGHARDVGESLSAALQDYMEIPKVRVGCEHDYYLWTAKYSGDLGDIPHIKGYIQPLHKIFEGGLADCPVVEEMREKVVCFEAAKWANDPDEIAEEFLKAVTKAVK